MKLIFKIAVLLLITSISSFAQNDECLAETQGYNMLLIGNSFFRPYAEKLDDMAIHAGLDNHNSTTVFRGGDNGCLLYTSPSPRDATLSRMPSSA